LLLFTDYYGKEQGDETSSCFGVILGQSRIMPSALGLTAIMAHTQGGAERRPAENLEYIYMWVVIPSGYHRTKWRGQAFGVTKQTCILFYKSVKI
jgi:hypothetical protein